MKGPIPDRTYHVVQFKSEAEANAFIAELLKFFGSPGGVAYLARPVWVEVWDPSPLTAENRQVYLSDGALLAARAAGMSVLLTGTLRGDALPLECALIVGAS